MLLASSPARGPLLPRSLLGPLLCGRPVGSPVQRAPGCILWEGRVRRASGKRFQWMWVLSVRSRLWSLQSTELLPSALRSPGEL